MLALRFHSQSTGKEIKAIGRRKPAFARECASIVVIMSVR